MALKGWTKSPAAKLLPEVNYKSAHDRIHHEPIFIELFLHQMVNSISFYNSDRIKWKSIFIYRWVRAILLQIPIQYIGTYNSIAVTHRYIDLHFIGSTEKADGIDPKSDCTFCVVRSWSLTFAKKVTCFHLWCPEG
jgi:hypothetical protein